MYSIPALLSSVPSFPLVFRSIESESNQCPGCRRRNTNVCRKRRAISNPSSPFDLLADNPESTTAIESKRIRLDHPIDAPIPEEGRDEPTTNFESDGNDGHDDDNQNDLANDSVVLSECSVCSEAPSDEEDELPDENSVVDDTETSKDVIENDVCDGSVEQTTLSLVSESWHTGTDTPTAVAVPPPPATLSSLPCSSPSSPSSSQPNTRRPRNTVVVPEDACIVCGKSLKGLKHQSRVNHIKRCSKKHGVTARDQRVDEDDHNHVGGEDETHVAPTAPSTRMVRDTGNPYVRHSFHWHKGSEEDLALAQNPTDTNTTDRTAASTGTTRPEAIESSMATTARNLNNVLMAGARRMAVGVAAAKAKKTGQTALSSFGFSFRQGGKDRHGSTGGRGRGGRQRRQSRRFRNLSSVSDAFLWSACLLAAQNSAPSCSFLGRHSEQHH